ncbi:MAG: cobyrinate a,c-diamide synthase [Steroidobacteraceae bacterium]
MTVRHCPALFVSAPASGQGKTTVTAALTRLHRARGRRVRVFKVGPDFLDPTILACSAGAAVYQLDAWLGGEAHCRRLLYEAAQRADLILLEGVMGLHDGTPSSAEFARSLGVPVVAVIDAEAMAQTFGAVALGLASYLPELPWYGALGNRVASERHAQLLREGMPSGMRLLGTLAREAACELPDRHLGLVQAQEVDDLDERLARAATLIAATELAALPPAVEFAAVEPVALTPLLAGVRIGIARDRAFSFIYQANLDLLEALGARLEFFSPLTDPMLPAVDSVYLPGGYPELHLDALSANRAFAASLLRHAQAGKPLYAECGGLLYLLESVTDMRGRRAIMSGILPGNALMHARLKGLGYQSAPMPGGMLRGHTFHHSTIETNLPPAACAERREDGAAGEPIYVQRRVVGSYFHAYFPSNPIAAARLFQP